MEADSQASILSPKSVLLCLRSSVQAPLLSSTVILEPSRLSSRSLSLSLMPTTMLFTSGYLTRRASSWSHASSASYEVESADSIVEESESQRARTGRETEAGTVHV